MNDIITIILNKTTYTTSQRCFFVRYNYFRMLCLQRNRIKEIQQRVKNILLHYKLFESDLMVKQLNKKNKDNNVFYTSQLISVLM